LNEAKKIVGRYAADFIKPGMTIGIGSGTTVYWLIMELGARIRQGLTITAIPTSIESANLAKQEGIIVSDLNAINKITLTIDGADEIDPAGNLVKGGGGALLQEKIVAAASAKLIIIADDSKLVDQLGKFPLAVEVIPFGYVFVKKTIMDSGLCKRVTLRKKNDKTFITDHQHYILDCECDKIEDPRSLNVALHLIPGVVETGLFVGMTHKAIIGHKDGSIEEINY